MAARKAATRTREEKRRVIDEAKAKVAKDRTKDRKPPNIPREVRAERTRAHPKHSARSRIDVYDVINRVLEGQTYNEIAVHYKTSICAINSAIEAAGEEAQIAHRRAKELSAEAWLDRGLQAVELALRKDGEHDAAAARAYAQECARRAGIRNRAYRDRSEVEHSGAIAAVHYVAELPLVAGSTAEWVQMVGGEVLPAPGA